MTFSKIGVVEGIRAGLWESAVLFTQRMFKKIHEVNVSLDELRDGVKKIIHINTNCKCNTCNGRGYLSNVRKFCEFCKGKRSVYQ